MMHLQIWSSWSHQRQAGGVAYTPGATCPILVRGRSWRHRSQTLVERADSVPVEVREGPDCGEVYVSWRGAVGRATVAAVLGRGRDACPPSEVTSAG